jgi:hypothetical protein
MQKQNNAYGTIKDLVFDTIHRTKGFMDYDTITAKVKKHFPKSKWNKTHWSWYRTQIKNGQFKNKFSEEERTNLSLGKKNGQPKDNKVKRVGDAILRHIRFMIGEVAGDDISLRFKLNRWIFARLQQEEIKAKRPVKQKLWDSGMTSCRLCGKKFNTLKDVEIHRNDSARGYSVENCILLCRPCHQKTV